MALLSPTPDEAATRDRTRACPIRAATFAHALLPDVIKEREWSMHSRLFMALALCILLLGPIIPKPWDGEVIVSAGKQARWGVGGPFEKSRDPRVIIGAGTIVDFQKRFPLEFNLRLQYVIALRTAKGKDLDTVINSAFATVGQFASLQAKLVAQKIVPPLFQSNDPDVCAAAAYDLAFGTYAMRHETLGFWE